MNVLALNNCPHVPTTSFQANKRKMKKDPVWSKGSRSESPYTVTLRLDNLAEAVRLPPGEDINEWLAIHTVDFYNQIIMLYATLGDVCTPNTCPIMNAGSRHEYMWADGITIKKPIMVSAPQYVEYLMDWIENQINDETIFPKEFGEPFPPHFKDLVKNIMRRMFRVYGHIYNSHFREVVNLEMEAHFNTCFKHFVLFITEYELVDKKEMAPLQDLVNNIFEP